MLPIRVAILFFVTVILLSNPEYVAYLCAGPSATLHNRIARAEEKKVGSLGDFFDPRQSEAQKLNEARHGELESLRYSKSKALQLIAAEKENVKLEMSAELRVLFQRQCLQLESERSGALAQVDGEIAKLRNTQVTHETEPDARMEATERAIGQLVAVRAAVNAQFDEIFRKITDLQDRILGFDKT